jgi:Nuclease-related domain
MIKKVLDPFDGSGRFELAGRKAEEQMAFYLRRFFGSSADVDVLNYLRIDLNGEVAQIDHLVLHPFGLLIVESKSVSNGVKIADDGQWMQYFNGRPSGMKSPITQAQLQGMLLKELLERTVKQKGFFDNVRLDVLVAISDSGTITWPKSGALPEVCKADQVPDRINNHIEQSRKLRKEPDILTGEHRRAIADFLLEAHKPLERSATHATPQHRVEEPRPEYKVSPTSPIKKAPDINFGREAKVAMKPALFPSKVCKHCQSNHLEAKYGQYGYYFFCRDCSKNTKIAFACVACGGEGKVRKQANNFFAECKVCSASNLFHNNPAT